MWHRVVVCLQCGYWRINGGTQKHGADGHDELVAQGLVESKQRIGLFVASDSKTVTCLRGQSAAPNVYITAAELPLPASSPGNGQRH